MHRMLRGPRRLAARALLACALAPALAHAAPAKCTATTWTLPVRMSGTRVVATVGINGTQVPLIVDTGMFYSMLTGSAAAALKLPLSRVNFQVMGLSGKVDGLRMTTVDHLQLLGGELPDVEFLVGGNELGEASKGLIGRNLLAAMDTEFDLAHGAIRFIQPRGDCDGVNMAYWAHDTPVSELRLTQTESRTMGMPAFRAVVELNGKPTMALFDTGATTMVSLAAAHRAGLQDADMKPSGHLYGLGTGTSNAWSAKFASVAIADETIHNNQLTVADFDIGSEEMLIGVDFFLSHRIYISPKHHRMMFTYNGGAVFAQNHVEAVAAVLPASGASSAPDTLSADEHARRGSALFARRDLPAALAELDRACALAPADASYLFTRARIHGAMHDEPAMVADLDAALRAEPTNTQALLMRAGVQAYRQQREAAAADLATLDKTLPPQAAERYEMAGFYEQMALREEALAQWTLWIAAHEHDYRLPVAHNDRCRLRVELNRELERAREDCDDAVDADPKNANFVDSRAWLWLRLGQAAKARRDFDKAVSLRPQGAISLYGRSLARTQLDDAAGAQADLAAARAASPRIDATVKLHGLPLAADADAASAKAAAARASAPASSPAP